MQKNTKVLLIVCFVVIISLIVVAMGAKRFRSNRSVTEYGQNDTSSPVEETSPKAIMDKSIVTVEGANLSEKENEVIVNFPQLVGETADIKKANEEIKKIYLDSYEKNQNSNSSTIDLGFTYGVYQGILSFQVEMAKREGQTVSKEYAVYNFYQDTLNRCSNEDVLNALNVTGEEVAIQYNRLLDTYAKEGYQFEEQAGTLEAKGISSLETYLEKLKENAKITTLLDSDTRTLYVSDEGEAYTWIQFKVGGQGPCYEKYLNVIIPNAK